MGDVMSILLLVPPLLFALTFHEYSHAYVATRLGDPTAKLLGRLTLNPLVHLDPAGTIVFVLTRLIGWAKPVPVDERYLKHPHRDLMWIALAGPVSNVILAFLLGTILRFAYAAHPSGGWEITLIQMIAVGVRVNLALAIFNLIPIFPLDGSRVLSGLLSPVWAERYRQLDPVGPFLLLGIVVLGMTTGVNVFGAIVSPFVYILSGLFTGGVL